jgi:septation ring formation regulator EzrA
MAEAVEMQLENIEKRFLDFEKVMEANEYSEVVHVCKALDTMIEHMDIIITEMPDILLMAQKIIPNRMKEVSNINKEMTASKYDNKDVCSDNCAKKCLNECAKSNAVVENEDYLKPGNVRKMVIFASNNAIPRAKKRIVNINSIDELIHKMLSEDDE